MSEQALEPGWVRMSHPDLDEVITVKQEAAPHHVNAGWQVVEGEGEEWPPELQRFEGAEQVRMRHPDLDQVITVGAQAVPFHREKGWLLVDEDAVTEEAQAADDLDSLTVEELKAEAKARDLPVSGTKAELIDRLRSTQQDDAGDQPAQPTEEEG